MTPEEARITALEIVVEWYAKARNRHVFIPEDSMQELVSEIQKVILVNSQ